jgi:hypothetical protein
MCGKVESLFVTLNIFLFRDNETEKIYLVRRSCTVVFSTAPASLARVQRRSSACQSQASQEDKCNPCEPIGEFSEIAPDFVDLNNGFLSVEAVLPGECATLIYEIRSIPASQPSADSLFLLQLLSPLLSLISNNFRIGRRSIRFPRIQTFR